MESVASMTKIEIIKALLKVNKSKETVEIVRKDKREDRGIVEVFDGKTVLLSGKTEEKIPVDEIAAVLEGDVLLSRGKKYLEKITEKLGERVSLVFDSAEGQERTVDGVLLELEGETLTFITDAVEDGVLILDVGQIRGIEDYRKAVKPEEAEPEEIELEAAELSEAANQEYVPNVFEELVILREHQQVEEFLDNPQKLLKLGYTEKEIDRMEKSRKVVGWTKGNSSYEIASRLYQLQMNRGGLAEKYYEKALMEELTHQDEQYAGTLNVLATIYIKEDDKKFADFFVKYKKRLRQNPNYCRAYAESLVRLKKWNELKMFLPTYEQQVPDCEEKLEEYGDLLLYMSQYSKVDLSNLKGVRYEKAEDGEFDEGKYLSQLPGREAYRRLLNYYEQNQRYEAYFSVAEIFLKDMIQESAQMEGFGRMLQECPNVSYVLRFLPQLPVFWCDEILVKRFEEGYACAEDLEELTENTVRLLRQTEVVRAYPPLNQLESCIINDDIEELQKLCADGEALGGLGYTEEEIAQLQSIDLEQYEMQSGKMYTMRRLLEFEKNKNHAAERFLFEAMYTNATDMCSRLFPLLLKEGRGEWILALLEYNPEMKTGAVKERYYFSALSSSVDDETYYREMTEKWEECKDIPALQRLQKLAEKKGDFVLQKRMERALRVNGYTTFEKAMIADDQLKMRELVFRGEDLASEGYTPDEVARAQQIFSKGTYAKGTGTLQKARRIYVLQKNKNHLAEEYFQRALNEKDSAVPAAKELLSIYAEQENHSRLCEIYENYLAEEMKAHFNRLYGNLYCNALFERKQFEKLVAYWKEYFREEDEITFYPQLLYSAEISNADIDMDFVWEKAIAKKIRPDIGCAYMELLCEKQELSAVIFRVVTVFNQCFTRMNDEQLQKVKALFEGENLSCVPMPAGNGIRSLMDERYRGILLGEWYDYLAESMQVYAKLELIGKILDFYPDMTEVFAQKILDLYEDINIEGNSTIFVNVLYKLLKKALQKPEARLRWMELMDARERVDFGTLNLYWEYCREMNDVSRMHRFYMKNSAEKWEGSNQEAFLTLGREYAEYALDKKGLSKEELEQLLAFLEKAQENTVMTSHVSMVLLRLYIAAENYDRARMLVMLLHDTLRWNLSDSGDMDLFFRLAKELDDGKTYSLLHFVRQELSNPDVEAIDAFSRRWKPFCKMEAADLEWIEEMRNSLMEPEQWTEDAVNSLMKGLICERTNVIYWQLLEALAKDWDTRSVCSIKYHIADLSGGKFEGLLQHALELEQKPLVMLSVLKMLESNRLDERITAQKVVRKLLDGEEWFAQEEMRRYVPKLLEGLLETSKGLPEEQVWNTSCAALELAVKTGCEKEYAEIYGEYLSTVSAKHAGAFAAHILLMEERDEELLEKACGFLQRNYYVAPYKELILGIAQQTKSRPLSEAERLILDCSLQDYGNQMGVEEIACFYTRCVVEGKQEAGLEAAKILQDALPDDMMLYQLEIWFRRSGETLEEITAHYQAVYDYVCGKTVLKDMILRRYVESLTYGKYCLEFFGVSCKNAEECLKKRYPEAAGYLKQYSNFCESIRKDLAQTEYEALTGCIFKGLFTGNWQDVYRFRPQDSYVEELLDQLNIKRILARSPKEIIRSTAILTLNSTPQETESLKRRQEAIWNRSPRLVRRKFAEFTGTLQGLPEELKDIARRLWQVCVDVDTVYEYGFGQVLLEQARIEELAPMFAPFHPLNELFNNRCRGKLTGMGPEKGEKVAEAFDLQMKRQGIIQEKKNIFRLYLNKRNPGREIEAIGLETCQFWREKYLQILDKYQMGDTKNRSNLNLSHLSPEKQLKAKIEVIQTAAFYYLHIVCSNSEDEQSVFGTPTKEDYLNTLIAAASDSECYRYLPGFVGCFRQKEYRRAAYCMALILKGKGHKALQEILKIEEEEWKNLLCFYLYLTTLKSDAALAKKSHSYVKKRIGFILRAPACQEFYEVQEEQFLKGNKEISGDTAQYLELEFVRHILETEEFEPMEAYTEIPENLISEIPEHQVQRLAAYLDYVRRNPEEPIYEDSQKVKEVCRNLGFAQMRRQNGNCDKNFLMDMLGLLYADDCIDDMNATMLLAAMGKYIGGFEALDEFCRDYTENHSVILRLGEIKAQEGTRLAEDLFYWNKIIGVLDKISGDVLGALGDALLQSRLQEYDRELGKLRSYDMFRAAVDSICILMRNKQIALNRKPQLEIFVDGAEKSQGETRKTVAVWKPEKTRGFVSGYVHNTGAATALNVQLETGVGMSPKKRYHINCIYAGEKIPFKVSFARNDFVKDELSWDASVRYDVGYQEEEREAEEDKCQAYVQGSVLLKISDGEKKLGSIDFQQKATGKDFVGRNRELTILRSFYDDRDFQKGCRSLLVMGLRRAGKSSLLRYYLTRHRHRENLITVEVDGQGIGGVIHKAFIDDVLLKVKSQYRAELPEDYVVFERKWREIAQTSQWIGSLEEFYTELSDMLGGRKLLICMDEMEMVFYSNRFQSEQEEETLYGVLRSLIQNPDSPAAFIFCGSDKLLTSCLEQKRESQLFQTLYALEVGRMNVSDINQVFEYHRANSDIQFSDHAIDMIWNYTNGLIWYTKLIGSAVLTEILADELSLRDTVYMADVQRAVEMLITGELGNDKFDIIDKNFDTEKRAIIRAMAELMPDRNEGVRVQRIVDELDKMVKRGYTDSDTGAGFLAMDEAEVVRHLELLRKMQFVEKDAENPRDYRFVSELYRFFMRKDKMLHKFTIDEENIEWDAFMEEPMI